MLFLLKTFSNIPDSRAKNKSQAFYSSLKTICTEINTRYRFLTIVRTKEFIFLHALVKKALFNPSWQDLHFHFFLSFCKEHSEKS